MPIYHFTFLINITDYRFLWVDLQLKAICDEVSDYGIEETLGNMPTTISKTYKRILKIIDKKPKPQRELARKALLFTAYSREPVSIGILAHAIAAKDHAQSLDTFRSSISDEERILDACSNLLIVDNTDSEVRRACFVHFSVHEFLTSHQSKLHCILSLEYKMAHREIARMCMSFLLILYSHLQDYCSATESSFANDYILRALPHHLLAASLNSLSPNDDLLTLALVFFKRGPPMLAPAYNGEKTFFTFSPPVLSLIFNLPGSHLCYNARVFYGKKLGQRVLIWAHEKANNPSCGCKDTSLYQIYDNRLAMHYAAGQLDSLAVSQRLSKHGYPTEYSCHNSDPPLNSFFPWPVKWEPGVCKLTPLYLVKSMEVAKFLLDKGCSVNPQATIHGLPNLLGFLAKAGNTEVFQLLLDRGAGQDQEAQSWALISLAYDGNVEAIRLLLDSGADVNAQGGEDGNILQAAAYMGNGEARILLENQGADRGAQEGRYSNALQAAACNGKVEAMRLLLERGADIHAQGGSYGNVLQAAAHTGNVQAIQLLLDEGADVDEQGGEYGNALLAAACSGNIDAIQLFLDKGVDIHVRGEECGSSLQAAASSGNTEAMRLLLDRGVDVNVHSGFFASALGETAICGNIEGMQLLLDKGADIQAPDVLQYAAMGGKIEAIRFLLDKGADVNIGGPENNALEAAVSNGHVEAVEFLLDRGADVNACGALPRAARSGKIDLVQLLLNRGADINAPSEVYGTPLQAAACTGKHKVMKLLLDREDVDINAQSEHYGTALQAAVECREDKAVLLLLQRGADIRAQGGTYGNVLQAAAWSNHVCAIKFLLKMGADIHAQGGKYGNVLQAAAHNGNVEAMEFLILEGVDVHVRGGIYDNAFQAAAYSGNISALKFLREKGVDIHVQGGLYGNALQAAAFNGSTDAMQYILDNGADVNAQGGKYGNALQAAAFRGNIEAIQFLLDKGADIHMQGGIYGTALQAALVPHRGNLDRLDYNDLKNSLRTAKILLDHGADVTVNVPDSKYGDALSAAEKLWEDDKVNLPKFMKLLESYQDGSGTNDVVSTLTAANNGGPTQNDCTDELGNSMETSNWGSCLYEGEFGGLGLARRDARTREVNSEMTMGRKPQVSACIWALFI